MVELDEDLKQEIYSAFADDGVKIKDIMKQYKITLKQWKQIKSEFEGGEGEEEEEEPIQKTIEKAAEKSAVDIAVKTTKETAKEIQQTKFNIGDAVYNLLFQANLTTDQMLEFVAQAITFYFTEYDNIEKLKAENQKYNDILADMYELFDNRKQALRLAEEYQKECILNDKKPDRDYVLSMLKYYAGGA